MQFSVYYRSPENGEYLRQVVAAAGTGQLAHFQELSGLSGESGADVVLVEYQDNNPHLDHLLAQIMEKPLCPEVFLFVEEVSPCIIWKALKLGARELFSRTIPPEDFQAALLRVEMRHGRLLSRHTGANAWSGPSGWLPGWGACCGI